MSDDFFVTVDGSEEVIVFTVETPGMPGSPGATGPVGATGPAGSGGGLPDLPDDGGTYTLKCVAGSVSWVED